MKTAKYYIESNYVFWCPYCKCKNYKVQEDADDDCNFVFDDVLITCTHCGEEFELVGE